MKKIFLIFEQSMERVRRGTAKSPVLPQAKMAQKKKMYGIIKNIKGPK